MVEYTGNYTTTDEGDYDRVTVQRGHLVVEVGDAETLENVIIDQSAPDTASTVVCTGGGWEVRNVGVDGRNSDPHAAQFELSAEDDDCRLENVTIPDGGTWSETHQTGTTAIHATEASVGSVEIRHCFIGGFPDVAIKAEAVSGYATAYGENYGQSNPETSGGGGVEIVSTYVEHCGTAICRLGADSVARNCVFRNALHTGIRVTDGATVRVVNSTVNANGGSTYNRAGAGTYAFDLGDHEYGGFVEVENTRYNGKEWNVRRRFNGDFYDHGGNSHVVHTTPQHGTPTTTDAAASGSMDSTSSTGEEYEVIEINPGERRYLHIDDGETFENKLIDVRASNCACTLMARGTDWTIRNVGWKGRSRDHTHIGCEETGGGTARIENVYIGDGAVEGHRNGLGVYLHGGHNGHLIFDGVNIQEMGDNSFYCSTATGGQVTFRNCYSKNSWVSHYRVACPSTIENCVAVNDDNGMSQRDGRGIWSWSPGPCEVRNCHFDMNGRHYSFVPTGNGGGRIHVYDTQWDNSYHGGVNEGSDEIVQFHSGNGNNPQDVVPGGCPTSAEQAASGGSTDEVEYEPPEHHRLENVHVENPTVTDTVGVRAVNGTVEVINSEIGGPNAREATRGGSISSSETRWGSSASPSPPSGIPLSAYEASGHTANGSDPDANR